MPNQSKVHMAPYTVTFYRGPNESSETFAFDTLETAEIYYAHAMISTHQLAHRAFVILSQGHMILGKRVLNRCSDTHKEQSRVGGKHRLCAVGTFAQKLFCARPFKTLPPLCQPVRVCNSPQKPKAFAKFQ